jgi:hypothetical protein
MEGCLDGWVSGNKFFHYKLTGFGTYTHRCISQTGEGVDINAYTFCNVLRDNWSTSEHNTAVDLTELEWTGLIWLRGDSSSNRF